jgi:hypothetical protein
MTSKTDIHGTTTWYNANGDKHRDNDLPAIEYANGNKSWYVNGLRHRDRDLPAIEYANGDKWWFVNGRNHRDHDLHAFERENVVKTWFVNGKRHRNNGLPAIEHANGHKEWFIYDKQYTYGQVINYYNTLTIFGRYCLKKIRMRRLRHSRWICGELLCMPPKYSYPGGQDYHKMVNYFMSM